MLISIITVVYNNRNHIEDCVRSVLKQTYNSIEYIVIDGGSTDGTLQILEKYKSNIAILRSEPDKGMYDALNKGIALAKGDIVGLLHSDDFFHNENVISNIADKFAEKHIHGTYGDLLYVDKDDSQKVIRYWKSKSFHKGLLAKGWMPPHPTLFLKRDIYEQTGLFNMQYKIAADYDFMVRVLMKSNYTFEYIPEIITCMRVGGVSNKGFRNIYNKSREDYLIMKRNKIGGLLTLIMKNISKLSQFLKK
jgi:glycosyltransferase involved in cell wall biosynthesis